MLKVMDEKVQDLDEMLAASDGQVTKAKTVKVVATNVSNKARMMLSEMFTPIVNWADKVSDRTANHLFKKFIVLRNKTYDAWDIRPMWQVFDQDGESVNCMASKTPTRNLGLENGAKLKCETPHFHKIPGQREVLDPQCSQSTFVVEGLAAFLLVLQQITEKAGFPGKIFSTIILPVCAKNDCLSESQIIAPKSRCKGRTKINISKKPANSFDKRGDFNLVYQCTNNQCPSGSKSVFVPLVMEELIQHNFNFGNAVEPNEGVKKMIQIALTSSS